MMIEKYTISPPSLSTVTNLNSKND